MLTERCCLYLWLEYAQFTCWQVDINLLNFAAGVLDFMISIFLLALRYCQELYSL